MSPEEILVEVRGEALGALSWMDGYTDTWPDGAQRRVTTQAEGEDNVIKRFEIQGYHPLVEDRPRTFRITVKVEEVEAT